MFPTTNQPSGERLPSSQTAPQFNAGAFGNVMPNNPNVPSAAPNLAPTMPEITPLGTPEGLPSPETQIGPGQSGGPVQPMPVPVPQQPVVVLSTTTTSDDTTATATNPKAAADTDRIEKEWVDKTKSVIAKTRSDPYMQAKQISAMMRDYVQKRYGRVVGKAPEDL